MQGWSRETRHHSSDGPNPRYSLFHSPDIPNTNNTTEKKSENFRSFVRSPLTSCLYKGCESNPCELESITISWIQRNLSSSLCLPDSSFLVEGDRAYMADAIIRLPLAFHTFRCSSHTPPNAPFLASSISSLSNSSSCSSSAVGVGGLAFRPRKGLAALKVYFPWHPLFTFHGKLKLPKNWIWILRYGRKMGTPTYLFSCRVT